MFPVFEGPHFGHRSSSVDGPASMVEHENEVFVYLVDNVIRPVLARSSDLLSAGREADWAAYLIRIRRMARTYHPRLYYRAVIESCNRELSRDNFIWHIAMRLLVPRKCHRADVIFKLFSKNDLTQVMDVICSLKSSEIRQIEKIYPSLFERGLEVDIETFTFGYDRKLLLRHTSVRHGNAGVGEERLKNTVRYLHEKVQETDNCPQLAIMGRVYELNEEDLRMAVDRYSIEYGKPLVEDLTRSGFEHFEHGLETKIRCAVNRPEFLAEKLYKAFGAMRDPNIHGMIDVNHHIDYETIVRVITTMAEGDMMMMKEKYRLKFEHTLEDDISVAFADRQERLHLIHMILNSHAPN